MQLGQQNQESVTNVFFPNVASTPTQTGRDDHNTNYRAGSKDGFQNIDFPIMAVEQHQVPKYQESNETCQQQS